MEEQKELNSLDEKLMELKKLVSIMKKDSEGHGYNYVSEESILLALNDKMIELRIKLTPRFVPGTLYSEVVNYQNAKGQPKTDVLVRSELQFIWKDIKTGETEVVDWGLLGQQADGSQALGSGLTYANRYFLLKYFNVTTSNDDPDKIRSAIAAEEERKKISAVQTKIKKAYEKIVQKYQTKEKVYEALGLTREEFIDSYNNPEKQAALLEQVELVLKGDK
jgi:hypothetical protein|nr:MAG TPA: ERF superfamily protein [Caudoviricetes sp.]